MGKTYNSLKNILEAVKKMQKARKEGESDGVYFHIFFFDALGLRNMSL